MAPTQADVAPTQADVAPTQADVAPTQADVAPAILTLLWEHQVLVHLVQHRIAVMLQAGGGDGECVRAWWTTGIIASALAAPMDGRRLDLREWWVCPPPHKHLLTELCNPLQLLPGEDLASGIVGGVDLRDGGPTHIIE